MMHDRHAKTYCIYENKYLADYLSQKEGASSGKKMLQILTNRGREKVCMDRQSSSRQQRCTQWSSGSWGTVHEMREHYARDISMCEYTYMSARSKQGIDQTVTAYTMRTQ